jgi:uncharacterized protein
MTKPIGPICNLDCKYCFYLEKEKLYPDERKWKMSDEVLETYIRQYIEQQQAPRVDFAWQGGEPTLLGVGYFRKVVELQKKYADGKEIHNAFQTNGTLLDEEWGQFLAESQFLVGLSIDGPRPLHDHYRVDKKQKGTFDEVVRGLNVLKKHAVEFNTLTVVNRVNSRHPLEVYRFLRDIGSGFVQFIPLVERQAPTRLKVLGFDLADPPELQRRSLPIAGSDEDPSREPESSEPSPVTDWSVESHQYGRFLCDIFDEWVRQDVGKVFVQLFDVALGNWMGLGSSLCLFAETCGSALAIEHNGDLYSCDHYVYSHYHLGNIMNHSLGEMVQSEQQKKFGQDKRDTLPDYCRKCEVRFACNGECPKHRFIKTPDGEDGLNYLCPAYKKFFTHIDPYMKTMTQLLRAGQPAAAIMPRLAAQRQQVRANSAPVGRNDPCPCGSGKKYKKCCGQ